MAVADTAAGFVDGDNTIAELRKAVADWRKAGQALHDAMRADAKAPNVDDTIARASPPNRRFREITTRDVGRALFSAFGRQWPVSGWIGHIGPRDVGKRVYLVGDVLQVENDEQRATRREVHSRSACPSRDGMPGDPHVFKNGACVFCSQESRSTIAGMPIKR